MVLGQWAVWLVVSGGRGGDERSALAIVIHVWFMRTAARLVHFTLRTPLALYRQLGRLEDAVAGYTAAIAVQPSAAAYHNRAATLEKLGRLPEALGDLDAAVRLDASSASSLNSRALVLERLGRPGDALDDWHAALALEPGNAAFTCNMAFALRSQGRFDEAIEAYGRALALAPASAAALANRAFCYRKVRGGRVFVRVLEQGGGESHGAADAGAPWHDPRFSGMRVVGTLVS